MLFLIIGEEAFEYLINKTRLADLELPRASIYEGVL
jgi:hypothetical protein